MSDGKFVLYARKIVNNPLLHRKQMQVEMIHPGMANVSRTALVEKLAHMYKTKAECISVFGLTTKFGGGRSTGFALIYNSLDEKKKFDQKKNLKRDGHVAKAAAGRKARKEIKGRQKKVRGKAKAAAAKAGGKKKK